MENHLTMSETVRDWREWFKAKGVKPVHARAWPDSVDTDAMSGAVRTDDGAVWAWSRECGRVEAWRADGDDLWDGAKFARIPGMREAKGSACVKLLSALDSWDALASERAADARRDDGLRGVFG